MMAVHKRLCLALVLLVGCGPSFEERFADLATAVDALIGGA